MTTTDAAERLSDEYRLPVTGECVRRWCEDGIVEYAKPGGRCIFEWKPLRDRVEERIIEANHLMLQDRAARETEAAAARSNPSPDEVEANSD